MNENMNPRILWTSDTHLGHDNIRKYSNRPFDSVEEMDEALIRNWNEAVNPQDTVWHLGDFCMGDQSRAGHLRRRLNGTIHLIWGNHDKREVIKKLKCFDSVQDVAEIRIGRDMIFMSHYGHRVWNRSHHGAFHFYGHSHGGLPATARSLDVGVDCWDYRPVTLDQIKERLASLGLLDTHTPHNHR